MIDALLTAMAEERGKYEFIKMTYFSRNWVLVPKDSTDILASHLDIAACEAHLERLVLTAALDRLGAVVVPREPTMTMLNAGSGEFLHGAVPREIYRAMIAAGETP